MNHYECSITCEFEAESEEEAQALMREYLHEGESDIDVKFMSHEHEWGRIERSLFAGTLVRRCTSLGCSFITLDLDDEDFDPEEA